MTDETVTNGWKWECPHCGEINSVDSDAYEDNQFGFEECAQCENFVRVESTVRIEFVAAAIRVEDIGLVKTAFYIKSDDTDELQRLAESIDDFEVKDDAEALKLVIETPAEPEDDSDKPDA